MQGPKCAGCEARRAGRDFATGPKKDAAQYEEYKIMTKEWIKESFSGKNDLVQLCRFYSADPKVLFHGDNENVCGFFLVFGSWNFVVESKQEEERMISLFGTILNSIQQRSDTSYQTGIIPIDNDDETLKFDYPTGVNHVSSISPQCSAEAL